MKPILNTEDIRKLKTDERLIECSCGKVNYYRFLCFHPRNTNYVILLNHCEEPERFFIQNLIDRLKKIMFNDKFGLTQAVLEGRKTMTRRIIKCPRTFRGEWVAGFNIHRRHSDKKIVDWPCMYDADEREFDMGEILPKYELGEVVAIAQSYMDVDRFHRKGKNAAYLEYLDSILPELKLHPGWTNKMFVKADLMPRHIEFTDRKVERLQDISDEDCLKEGIYEDSGDDEFPPSIFYEFEGNKDNGFDTPREAFAALIDKVSGKGTWESNPYVWAYEFELMK